jgi:hypothetical protein
MKTKKFNWIATLVVILSLALPWAVFADHCATMSRYRRGK